MNNAAEAAAPKVENGITRTIGTFKQPYFGVYWGTHPIERRPTAWTTDPSWLLPTTSTSLDRAGRFVGVRMFGADDCQNAVHRFGCGVGHTATF